MHDQTPPLFERVPADLFAPLGGQLAATYWRALATLYELEFEREPRDILRSTAIDAVEALLIAGEAERVLAAEAGNGETANANATRAAATRVVKRLETCGWFSSNTARRLATCSPSILTPRASSKTSSAWPATSSRSSRGSSTASPRS